MSHHCHGWVLSHQRGGRGVAQQSTAGTPRSCPCVLQRCPGLLAPGCRRAAMAFFAGDGGRRMLEATRGRLIAAIGMRICWNRRMELLGSLSESRGWRSCNLRPNLLLVERVFCWNRSLILLATSKRWCFLLCRLGFFCYYRYLQVLEPVFINATSGDFCYCRHFCYYGGRRRFATTVRFFATTGVCRCWNRPPSMLHPAATTAW